MGSAHRAAAMALPGAVASCLAVASARADIKEYPLDPSATPLARAVESEPGLVRRAVFSAVPPGSKPALSLILGK